MKKVKTAGIFIVRKDDKILICHPTNHPVNFYSIPKGKIEEKETILDAALRETEEESNIDLRNLVGFESRYLGNVTYRNKVKELFGFLYNERPDSEINWDDIDIKCNSKVSDDKGDFYEMDGFKWVTLDEAMELLHEAQVKFIPKIKIILNLRKIK